MGLEPVYCEFLPENRLEHVVECFWSLKTGRDHFQWVLPDGCVDLLMRFCGNRCWVDVVETMTVPKHVKIPRGHTYLGVRFRPGMAKGSLPIDFDLGRDRILAISAFEQTRYRVLVRELISTPSVEDRVTIMASLIQVGKATPSAQIALNAMVENDGNIGLDALCDLARLSERQFRRYCVERTGVAPRMLARILRFRRARRLLQSEPHMNLSILALDAGYFDQAHFNREFKALARRTPGDFRKIPV